MNIKQTPPGPMAGKTVVVTGGTGGIGRACAVGLARLGARVAITGRDAVRAEDAAREVGRHGEVVVFLADLSSQAEVRGLAADLRHRLGGIDVLVNNVGGYWNSRHVTADGLERTFAVNHLAPFLLTNLLLDRSTLGPPARVVTVSSNAQRLGRIDFADLQGAVSYSGARAYNQSKLANVMFTYELARRHRGSGVTATALHPGVVRSSFGAEDPGRAQRVFVPVLKPFLKSPAQGAAMAISLASSGDFEQASGQYYANGKAWPSSKRSHDTEVAARLWRVSADLVGLSSQPH
ncbi:SDR family NAD(P)-dependent oxidoreductase [Jatrophihabitans sp. DSM 45814]